MAERLQVNPTRMELSRLKKKLNTATRGHKLLKDKRDELMRQFLDRVRENRKLRLEVEAGIRAANQEFMLARAGMQDAVLNTALLAPKQQVTLECQVENVMSVEVPQFTFHTRTPQQGDMFSYGFAFTSGDLDGAVEALAAVFPAMLRQPIHLSGGGEAAGGDAAAGGERKGLPADGGGNREDPAAGQRPGARDDSPAAGDDSLYLHEAGRERALHPGAADEGQGHDASRGPRV